MLMLMMMMMMMMMMQGTVRHCSSCVSRVHRCSRQTSDSRGRARNGSEKGGVVDNDTLWLEHVSMVSMLDSSVKIDVPTNHFFVNHRYRADTFQVSRNTLVYRVVQKNGTIFCTA